ncbi:MAG: hypothetical protein IPJ14_17690 [Kineosporiaceae bacterium]|nr:hypothetical protein [Kineosporiaceae bacterium]MBK7624435.1 hypothetical protein [Kineosporiaceae bacterium]MBK8077799.1 hypothetical protein [Kineosporiaceae bacterium]
MIDAVTDLDGTLVFTAAQAEPGQVVVDRYPNGRIGVLDRRAAEAFESLTDEGCLAVVTTRTIVQYTRMQLPGSPPALVDNGWRFLPAGREPDPDWTAMVDAEVAATSAPLAEVLDLLDVALAHLRSPVCQLRSDRFAQISVATGDLSDWVDQASRLIADRGWRLSPEGRRATLLPLVVDKGELWDRAAQRLGVEAFRAAGDSGLDLGLLSRAHESRSPAGSLLHREHLTTERTAPAGWAVTAASGPAGGAEIMAWFADRTTG